MRFTRILWVMNKRRGKSIILAMNLHDSCSISLFILFANYSGTFFSRFFAKNNVLEFANVFQQTSNNSRRYAYNFIDSS